MDNPAGSRKMDVNEFVAESQERIVGDSQGEYSQAIRNGAMAIRVVPTGKAVRASDRSYVFFFKVVATKPEMYGLRVKAPNLQAAKDYVAKIPEILSSEHVDESEIDDATFEKLAEGIDCLRRQSLSR